MAIAAQLNALRARIDAAAYAAGRAPGSVCLVGVAKTRTPAEVVAAVAAGLTDVGANYLDESMPAIVAVEAAGRACRWHFIGQIQSNKTLQIANRFDWVHSVDRLRIAERLARQRDPGRPPLNLLLQTNFDGESSKGGVLNLAGLQALAREVRGLPNVRLRGLMTIPAPGKPARAAFAAVRAALEVLRAETTEQASSCATTDSLDSLSMGMSDDFEHAVVEGATMLRIGSALFGARTAALRGSTATELPR